MAIEKYAMAGWDVMRALHDHTATALLLGSIGILALVDLTLLAHAPFATIQE